MPPTIFELCQPRKDALSGATRDEQFMADLSQVVNGTLLLGRRLEAWLMERPSLPGHTSLRGLGLAGGWDEPFAEGPRREAWARRAAAGYLAARGPVKPGLPG